MHCVDPRHTTRDTSRQSLAPDQPAYEAVLSALGRWSVYHQPADQEPHGGSLLHALTRLKPGSRITGEYYGGGFAVRVDFEAHDGDLVRALEQQLCLQGFPPSQALNPRLLSHIIAANPAALEQLDWWLRKQAQGKGGVYDPVHGDALRLQSGADFPNSFYCERFPAAATELWQQLASPVSPLAQFNPEHAAIQPIVDRPQRDAEGRYTIPSRFCGKTIAEMIDGCGRARALCKAWRLKPLELHVAPRELMLSCVVLDALDEGVFRSGNDQPLRDLSEIAVYPRRLEGARLLTRLEAHISELDELHRSPALGKSEADLAFVAMLLVKGLYLDEALRQIGVSHGHLHEGNITWEAVRRGDAGLDIRGKSVLFDAASYRVAGPDEYMLVTRMIDLAGVRRGA